MTMVFAILLGINNIKYNIWIVDGKLRPQAKKRCDGGKVYKFVEGYSDTFIERSEFLTNEEITTNRPSIGQNIALELDATVDITLLDPIWMAQRSLAAVSLSSEQKLKKL